MLKTTLQRIAALPELEPGSLIEQVTPEALSSVAYLGSDEAMASLEADCYWPKWHSPWWHMLLLHERGQAALIPPAAAQALVRAIDRLPLKIFPTRAGDAPGGLDPLQDSSCHCALGCVLPLLLACGIDVDAALPWAKDWFSRYQMADGGLSCDNDAYGLQGQVPSSMVGTIAPIEAVLELTAVRPRLEDELFLERAAGFLALRELTRGSHSAHNAEERHSAVAWALPTFPRFYLYDVLRGLHALLTWAHTRKRSIAWASVSSAVSGLLERFPDGRVSVQRRAFDDHMTRVRAADGTWTKREPASGFALLAASSRIGEPSASLSRQWSETRRLLIALGDAGMIIDA